MTPREVRGPQLTGRVSRAGLALVLLSALAFGVVSPPERCPSVTAGELRGSAQAASDWLIRNQAPDGTWLYLYNADEDSTASEYNLVRHAGAVMGLDRAAAEGVPGALASADRGTAWALDRTVQHDGWSAFGEGGDLETGASALLAAGLTLRREVTGDRRYDALLRRLGRFLVVQTEPSGAVLASYDLERGPVSGENSKYFTGEAYWALARLHEAFPGEGWGQAADRIGAYLATSRDDDEGYWPPIADHWAGYGLAETVNFPERGRPALTADELAYAREQAEIFGGQVRWVSERFGPWGALVRPGGVPRGGGYGVIGEGLTGLWLAAQQDPRLANLRAPMAERASCIAGLAVRTQSDREDAADFARPDRVAGAWFLHGETRMDDQQHALAALLRTIPIVESGQVSGSPSPDDEAPSWSLWAFVLLLALNPMRAAFGVPRAGRPPRDRIGLAALGGALGGLAVCLVAMVGDPLLGALDVSDASFRVAAGVIAVMAGIADFFRRPPPPEPALPGRWAALVPVAIPLVARPGLLVIAVGGGAERGGPVAAAAMAIGVGLLVALTAWWPTDETRLRLLRWASRLGAAALVATGVVLGVDGVFDV
jgi:small neutral amino acid transporter SnatA (MarC family)